MGAVAQPEFLSRGGKPSPGFVAGGIDRHRGCGIGKYFKNFKENFKDFFDKFRENLKL